MWGAAPDPMDPTQPSGAVARLSPLLHRVVVWSVCALLGWLGARFISSHPTPPAIQTQDSALALPDPRTPAQGVFQAPPMSDRQRQEAIPPMRTAEGWVQANDRVPRDSLLGWLSNAAPALTNLAEARSTALTVLSMPQLHLLSSESNQASSSLISALDPTLRRRISIDPTGKVRSSALRHTGNPEDHLILEHPSDAAASEFAPPLLSTNAVVAIRYANREMLVWNVELAVVQARFTNVVPTDSIELSADGGTAALTRPTLGLIEWKSLRGGRFQSGVVPAPGVTRGIPSPNGQTLALCSSPNAPISLIRLQDGQKIGSLPTVHFYDQLQWSSDSHWIAVGGPDGLISIWRSDTFQLISTVRQPDTQKGSWAFLPGRMALLALDSSGTLSLRDLWTGIPQLQVSTGGHSFQVAPDGDTLWIQRQDGRVTDRYRLDWSSPWSVPLQQDVAHPAGEYPLVWDKTGSVFVVGSTAGLDTYRVGSGYQGTLRMADPIMSLHRLPETGKLWITTAREVFSGDVEGMPNPGSNPSWNRLLQSARDEYLETTVATNGFTFAVRYADRISIHTRGTRALEIRTLAPANGIELTADGRLLSVTSSKGGVQILATSTGTVLWSSPEKRACKARFSPDGSLLAVGTAQHYDLWSVGEFSRQWRVDRGNLREWPSAMEFSPDGAWFACVGGPDDLRILNTANGREHFRLGTSPVGAVAKLRFSPNQRYLVALQSAGRATVWDMDGLKAGLSGLGLGLEKR